MALRILAATVVLFICNTPWPRGRRARISMRSCSCCGNDWMKRKNSSMGKPSILATAWSSTRRNSTSSMKKCLSWTQIRMNWSMSMTICNGPMAFLIAAAGSVRNVIKSWLTGRLPAIIASMTGCAAIVFIRQRAATARQGNTCSCGRRSFLGRGRITVFLWFST